MQTVSTHIFNSVNSVRFAFGVSVCVAYDVKLAPPCGFSVKLSPEIHISLCLTALFRLSGVVLDMLASTVMIVSNNSISKLRQSRTDP